MTGMPIAVNVDTRESDVASLSQEKLTEAVTGAGLTVVNSGSDLASAISEVRTSRSIWRTLLIAALVILLLESVIADSLGARRAKRAGAPQGGEHV